MKFISLLLTLFVGIFILIGSLYGINNKKNKKITDFSISMAFGVIIFLIIFSLIPETYEVLNEHYIEIIKSEDKSTGEKIFAINEYIDINKDFNYEFITPFIIELENSYLFNEELELFEKIDNTVKDEIIKNDIMKNKIHIYQMLGMYKEQEELAIIYNEKNNNKQSKEIRHQMPSIFFQPAEKKASSVPA